MANTVDSTLSAIDLGGAGTREGAFAAALFVVLEAHRPWAGSTRHLLSGIDTIEIGRAETRGAARVGSVLRLAIPDRWLSTRHARLECRLGRWLLTDQDSKNGTSVDGAPIRAQALFGGELIGVGHTLLRLRTALEVTVDQPLDIDADQHDFGHPAFATLVPVLASELSQARRLARADNIPFLIRGESGAGKEILARAVHELSARSGEFVAVNCGAIPSNLIESELFGHVRGAFSGAVSDKLGLVRAADGGTLLLDEIGDLAGASQAALLRVLQEREVTPVGATRPVPIDVRFLSATHRDLDQMTERGEFRGDLYARLAGYSVTLPPLRERADDIGLFVASIFGRKDDARSHPGFSIEAARAIAAYEWPMNVRELEAALRAAAALAQDELISLEHLPSVVREPAGSGESDDDVRDLLVAKLREHGGNVSAIARDLGKDRKQVQRWLKKYELDAATYR